MQVIWESIPSDEDTLLLAPNDIQFSSDGLMVFDAGDRTVRLFQSTDGSYLGSLGRAGGGPGELSQLMWFQGAYDRPSLIDRAQRRIVKLTGRGDAFESVPLPSEKQWLTTCAPEPDLTFGAARSRDHTAYFFARDQHLVDSMVGPWTELRDEDHLATQARVRQADDTSCAVLPVYQSVFAIYTGQAGFLTGQFVERGPPVRAITSSRDGGRSGAITLPKGTTAGPMDARVWRDHLAVLFEGRSRHRRRVLDLYRREDLSYAGTLVLPIRAARIAISGDTLAVLGERDDYPLVVVLLLRAR
jgi:hypothetical protein